MTKKFIVYLALDDRMCMTIDAANADEAKMLVAKLWGISVEDVVVE